MQQRHEAEIIIAGPGLALPQGDFRITDLGRGADPEPPPVRIIVLIAIAQAPGVEAITSIEWTVGQEGLAVESNLAVESAALLDFERRQHHAQPVALVDVPDAVESNRGPGPGPQDIGQIEAVCRLVIGDLDIVLGLPGRPGFDFENKTILLGKGGMRHEGQECRYAEKSEWAHGLLRTMCIERIVRTFQRTPSDLSSSSS